MEKGQWLFTCDMRPQQFSHIIPINLENYDASCKLKSKQEQEDFINDNFVTLNGSHHSKKNCGCKPISEAYALWFNKNEIWKIADVIFALCETNSYISDNRWEIYEEHVKYLAEKDGLVYEGI